MKLFTRCRSLQIAVRRLLAMAVVLCPLPVITGSETRSTIIIPLEHREVEHRIGDFYLPVIPGSVAFTREPSVEEEGEVRRGRIQLHSQPGGSIAFLWDWKRGRLYLDLNRNEDLTDDPEGAFTSLSQPSFDRHQQTFTGIRLNIPIESGSCPMLLDLTLSAFMQLHARAGVRSFFSGKATLGERDWEVGVVFGPDGRRGSLGGTSMLLRPWDQREQDFKTDSGSTDAFPFPSNLFFQGEAYRILRAFDFGHSPPSGRLTFASTTVSTGSLEFRGAFVPRLILLEGPWTTVIDDPSGLVSVPTGIYEVYRLQVRQGTAVARPNWLGDRGVLQRVVIEPEGVAQLTAGGPLTNMVSVKRRSQHVVFDHWLAGADGSRYQMLSPSRGEPPRFTVFQGDKAIASGNFEFG
jgi:hypothetical protein